MIAGGASLAPRRWSLPASAIDARSRSAWTLTPRMTASRNARNWALACGVLPGSSRFSPLSVAMDQLLCLPLPLMPANGFSWMSSIRPCWWASLRMVDITIMLWSLPTRRGLEDGRHLELRRCDLVMPRLGRDAQAPQLAVEIHHEREDPLADGAEILVLQLLALG